MPKEIRADRVRILIFVKRKEGTTQEEFDRYWLHEHSKLYSKFVANKKNPLIYEQLHVNQEEREKMKKHGVPVLNYDGVVSFDVDSFQGFEDVLDDEYWNVIVPDEAEFSNRGACVIARVKVAPVVPFEEDKAGLPDKEVRKNRGRMLIVFERKEGLSDEEFTKAWLHTHPDVIKTTPLGKKVIKYDQVREQLVRAPKQSLAQLTPPTVQCHMAQPLQAFEDPKDGEASVPKWSGIAAVDVPSFAVSTRYIQTCIYSPLIPDSQLIIQDFNDPETAKALVEDEVKWQAPGTRKLLPIDVARIIDRT
ncbi:hypothetical protein AAF712_003502 [Marasmius tenuissimus]|uniref:EthD domain-containing protein n=1 Tax=Marasmius tenuissimus TaxID=585030 RepID=A0ABR3A678_9AGAR